MNDFKGKTITTWDLFNQHQTKTKYCGSHYIKTLRQMVDDGLIEAEFTDSGNHRVSVLMNQNSQLTFKTNG